jgi:hypothetical protein
LFGVPPEKQEIKASFKETNNIIDEYRNKDLIIEKTDALVRTLEPERVLNKNGLSATQKVSDDYYPTRGVVTVGILMSVIGVLLFSPVKLPSIYRFVGGVGFLIMGISVIGSGLLNSRKSSEANVD